MIVAIGLLYAIGFLLTESQGLLSADARLVSLAHAGTPIRPEDLEVGAVAQVLPELPSGTERTLENVVVEISHCGTSLARPCRSHL